VPELGLVLGVEHRPDRVGKTEIEIEVVTAEREALLQLATTVAVFIAGLPARSVR
jgi:hypothetical protein